MLGELGSVWVRLFQVSPGCHVRISLDSFRQVRPC
jgi:hypothetical protein